MILIGRYLSPFVRRSAIALNLVGAAFEQKVVTTDNVEELSKYNPLLRVPALVLDNNEIIVDSHAIVDYLLTELDSAHTLCPAPGAARRQVMRISAIAVGAMEKLLVAAYERSQRPAELVHEPYREKVLAQAAAGFSELNTLAADQPLFGGAQPNIADVNAVVAYDFGMIVAPTLMQEANLDHLSQLAQNAHALPAFASTRWQG